MRRPTVIFLLLFVMLTATYYFLNNREQPADISLTLEPTMEVAYLFPAENGLPTSIRIESKTGEIVEVARDADNAWQLIQPAEVRADQASAEAAASQVTTMQILDTVPDVDPEIVGLTDPEYTVTVKFTSDVERTVGIGVVTPSESGYYVRNREDIVIISRSSVDALLGLLTNPPYLETPTAEAATPSNATPTP